METRTFHASSEWTIQYSMTCRSDTANFSIVTYHGDGSYGDLLENLITKRISKTQYIHEGGDWYLKIDGDCPWRVRVTGAGKPASTRPPGGKTLLAVSATGTMSTKKFTARADWTISYTFTCRAETSNFSITTYHGNNQYGDLLENLITKRLNKTQYLHERGSWYLKIDGGCPWPVTVRG